MIFVEGISFSYPSDLYHIAILFSFLSKEVLESEMTGPYAPCKLAGGKIASEIIK